MIGILLVRDAKETVVAVIRHVFGQGVDEVLVVDNGSTDGTTEILARLAGRFPLRYTRDDGPYDQAERMTALAAEAASRRATWVVPFDGDEFPVGHPNLRQALSRATAPALAFPLTNLVQFTPRQKASRSAMTTMRFVARPWAHRDDVLSGRASFVELAYPPKVVFRATSGVVVARGQHRVQHPDGPTVETRVLHMIHAPLTSFERLIRRSVTASRHLSASGGGRYAGWHLRRWAELAATSSLTGEWRANSHRVGVLVRPDGSRVRLRPFGPWRRALFRRHSDASGQHDPDRPREDLEIQDW